MAGLGEARPGEAGRGVARPGEAGPGAARPGTTRGRRSLGGAGLFSFTGPHRPLRLTTGGQGGNPPGRLCRLEDGGMTYRGEETEQCEPC
jgi:hypothetical protein